MKKSSGQTLIEMVVAVGMVSLVLVAIVSGIAISIRNSRFSKNKALATRYAQEGIEKFRFYRDEFGWIPFSDVVDGLIDGQSVAGDVEYCFADFPASLENIVDPEYKKSCTTEIIDDTYVRYAQIDIPNPPDYWVDVRIGVSWFEGASFHDVELTTRFNARTRK